MDKALTALEIVLVVAVFAVIGALGGMFWRRWALSREGNMAVLATRVPGGSWRTGMVRYRPDRLEWFSFRTLSLSPERVWERGEFFLGSRQDLGHDLPRAMTGDAIRVDVQCGSQEFSIAMAPGDYTALRSWSESAPPGFGIDRVI